jgi:NADPH:quinone reductase-like Zn-dependent oxidoreductase
MKALHSIQPGGPDTLALVDIPWPTAAAGQVVITIEACSVNYPDALIIEDRYQFKPQRPFAPGSEVAGTVSAVGEGVTGLAVGDRVLAVTVHGGMAEAVAAPARDTFKIPASMSFDDAASLLLTYGTVYHALVDRAHIEPGETLLVLGAAGGVGIAAIDLGKALGAKVVAAVSSEEKAAVCRERGADTTLVYPRDPGSDPGGQKALAQLFKSAVGDTGANVIFDAIGGDYAEPALRSIAWEGRYLVVGFPSGIPKPPLNLVLLKGCDLVGVFWGAFTSKDPAHHRRNVEALLGLYEQGKIKPLISAHYPLAQGGEAIRQLSSRNAVGKIVVHSRD